MADPLAEAIAQRYYPRARSYYKLPDGTLGFTKGKQIVWWKVGKRGASLAFRTKKSDPFNLDARHYSL
jgi:hypothetical protein